MTPTHSDLAATISGAACAAERASALLTEQCSNSANHHAEIGALMDGVTQLCRRAEELQDRLEGESTR